ncbi:hypothetical protein SAMN05421872_101571 [Nocardioides lianchengensis]|uniref:Uncharacterized protein n=1 Tax=Nocardioides lianchengensis TaxID=1045774 RepID=A0A1G6JSZ3_9ACTN|nr:hypothetical protein SAMN05421872_101571 [Nocardioides lianchengensis]
MVLGDSELLAALGASDQDDFNASMARLDIYITSAFKVWWHLHCRSWIQGAIGADAKGLAFPMEQTVLGTNSTTRMTFRDSLRSR